MRASVVGWRAACAAWGEPARPGIGVKIRIDLLGAFPLGWDYARIVSA
jgi:hypothetical protein